MNVTAAALRELHRLHRQLTDLKDRLERGPKQVRAAEGNVKRSELELAAAKEALTKTRVEADQKQLQLKGREMRISELQGKLNAASSNREYQALKEQIAADKQANSVLSDEILEALEKIDTCQAAVATAQANLGKGKEEYEKVKKRVDEAQPGLESEFARISADLKKAELVLPDDFKESYQRVAKVRGEGALAQVEGEFCGGCNQAITSQMYTELRMSKPVFCKTCGCLLYLPEDRAP
jgi:predicted  nucleic acid-binding Zn-ribbon protein